jgi:hypothetical protein
MTNQFYTPTGNPVAQNRGTSAAIRNEFIEVQAGFGMLPSPSQIAGETQNYVVDTGTASQIAVPFPSQITGWFDGLKLRIKIAANPVGASTIAMGGLATVALTRTDTTAIQIGDYVAGQIVEVAYSSATGDCQLATTGISSSSAASGSAAAAAASATAAAGSATAASGNATAAASSASAAATSASNAASAATTASLAVGLHANGATTVTTTGTLASTVGGGTVEINSASATTQTLPTSASVTTGSRVELININSGIATVSRNGSDTIVIGTGVSVSSLNLGLDDTMTLENLGSGSWLLIAGSVQLPYSAAFNAAIASAGPVIGSVRNLKAVIAAASSSITITADEIVTKSALGGTPVTVSNVNQTMTTVASGIGGMDTGIAPVSTWVYIYEMTGPGMTAGPMGTISCTGSIYTGGHAPAGYTESALVSIWLVNSGSQFTIGGQRDRVFTYPAINLLNTATGQGSYVSLNIANAVPPTATSVFLLSSLTSTAIATITFNVASDSSGSGQQESRGNLPIASSPLFEMFQPVLLLTAQTIWYDAIVSSGTPTYLLNSVGYTI